MENMQDNMQKAMNEAMDEGEFNKQKEMENNLAQAYLNGHINSDEYEALFDSEGNISKGITEFSAPEEFRKALVLLGFDQKTIDELFNHELEHYNTDIKNGFQPKLILQFYRLKNGQVAMIPSVRTVYPGENEDQERQQIKDSLSAPKDLSEMDKKKLGLE